MKVDIKKILVDIIGTSDMYSDSFKHDLLFNFSKYDECFIEAELVYDAPDEKEILKAIYSKHYELRNLYNGMILNILYGFAENYFAHSLDYVIFNYSQDDIRAKLLFYLEGKALPDAFKNDVLNYIKVLADRLDKRFEFDDLALINLIEASTGKNIYTEQSPNLHIGTGDSKYVVSNGDRFDYKRTSTIETRPDGSKYYVKDRRTVDNDIILSPHGEERLSEDKIYLDSFPLGSDVPINSSNVMQKLMSNLIENMSLCLELFYTYYGAGGKTIDNTATLADGSKFDFAFQINERNIPHILGIPRPYNGEVSQKSLDALNSMRSSGEAELTHSSRAIDLLHFVIKHGKEIIECGGLYADNGKYYEILNWEKIILKTTSFMRGDFFKTCFCLARLAPNKYLNDSSEMGGFVSISSTEYNKSMSSSRTASSVLNDLLNTTRQRKDFIFRGFKDAGSNIVVNSIMTGKSESVRVGNQNDILRTLQRYRNMFYMPASGGFAPSAYQMNQTSTQNINSLNNANNMTFTYYVPHNDIINPGGSSGSIGSGVNSSGDNYDIMASVATEVANELYLKTFTPEEQAQLGLDIYRNLFIVPRISVEAREVLFGVHDLNPNAVTSEELAKFHGSNPFNR